MLKWMLALVALFSSTAQAHALRPNCLDLLVRSPERTYTCDLSGSAGSEAVSVPVTFGIVFQGKLRGRDGSKIAKANVLFLSAQQLVGSCVLNP